jgi:hypothetical protein
VTFGKKLFLLKTLAAGLLAFTAAAAFAAYLQPAMLVEFANLVLCQ